MAPSAEQFDDRVLRQFDELIEQGELFYTPTKPTFHVDEGFEFEFRVCPSFKSKPQFAATDTLGHLQTAQSTRRPPPTDGSDIDHSDPAFFVAEIRGTHKLILNKFCVFRPQHLLLTLDPKRRQDEMLDAADFAAAWGVLRGLDGSEGGKGVRHYVVYNGGKAGGSSRRHKHMQVLAQPRAEDGDLELVGYKAEQVARLPCVAFFEELKGLAAAVGEDDGEAGRRLAGIAEEHYRLSKEALGGLGGGNAGADMPHNVMLTGDWMITVPRRAGTIEGRLEGHVVGCQGMLGSVWVSSEEQLKAWKEVGPANVVRELGVPRVSS